MSKKILSGIIVFSLLSFAIVPSVVLAQVVQPDPTLGFNNAKQIGGSAFGTSPLQDTIVSLVNILLGFLGIIAVIIILWGGFKWMTAGGNEEKVGEARSLIIAGIIGLAIIIASFAIAQFVVNSLTSATGGQNLF